MAVEKTIIIKGDTSDITKKVKKLDKQVSETSNTAKKTGTGLSGAFKGMGNAISGAIPMLGKLKAALISTGVGAIVVALGSFVALMKSAAEAGANFQKGLSTLRAVTGNTANELEVLNKQAKELGATTQFTAIEVVGLQTELAKLGFTIKDIENSTPAILDLAASLEVNLSSAAEFAGSVVRSFGLTTQETQRVVDVMAKSTSSSALNFEALTESIKVVAPAARATGVSVEKTAALLGILANNGLKGSVAGTGLSKTFIELNKKGITLEEGMDKVKNSSNKLNTAIKLVGVVGAKSFLSLAESGEAITNLEQQFINAEGAARSMAEVRLDNLEGDMTKLGSAWEGFLLGIEDGEGPLNDLQRTLVQGLTFAISKLGIAIDFMAFTFKESWENTKLITGGNVDLIMGYFTLLGNGIKLFSNKAILSFADIPIIGKAINKTEVEANINEAKEQLVKGAERIQEGVEKFKQASENRLTAAIRFRVQQEGKAERIEQAKQQKLNNEQQFKFDEENEEQKLKRLKAEKELQKQLKAASDLEAKNKIDVLKQIETAENEYFNSKLSKEELEKQAVTDKYFNLIEQAKLYGEETLFLEEAQAQALSEITKKYDEQDLEAKKKKQADEKALRQETINDLLAEKEAKAKIQLASIGVAEKGIAIGKQLAGKNKAIQKALLIAENAAGIAKIIVNTGVANAKAVAVSPITLGQPWVTINSLSAGLGIAGSIAATAKGLSALGGGSAGSKPNLLSGASGGGVSGSVSNVGSAPTPPSFNVVGASETSVLGDAVASQTNEPIQAYVVSNDITTAQSLENNIVEGATL